MEFKKVFKKIRPFLGIILMIVLLLACTAIVFFSVFSALILPLLWMIFTAIHQFKGENKKITYMWNAVRSSMWIYFSTLFLFLIWTPDWLKKLSLRLEQKSWFKVFSVGSYMYGRTSIAFICAIIVFIGFLIHYRLFVYKKKPSEITSKLAED